MNIATTLLIGGLVHALLGAGIFFAREEPYKTQVFLATTLKGLLVALLVGFSLRTHSAWGGALSGLCYGLAFGAVIFLAKGASFKTTPHVLIGSIAQGAVTGALIATFALK